MRYPSFLKKGGTIGVVAPSFGVLGYPYEDVYDNAIKKFQNLGYKVKEAEHIRGITKCSAAPAVVQGKELMDMYLNPEVNFITSVAGGELMNRVLPFIDFKTLSHATPKWYMGYSDNTHFTFTLPVFADTAALYGNNTGAFGQKRWDPSVQEAYDIITGKKLTQQSYPKYEVEDITHIEGNALKGYNKTELVEIKSLNGEEEVEISGRLIGGCMDVLAGLIGTPYGKIDDFLEKYKEDGFIWFMEAYAYDVAGMARVLEQLSYAGWFKYCKGFIFGRPIHPEEFFEFTLEDAYSVLKGYNVPILYGFDIGHIPPRWTVISGALANVKKIGNKAEIEYILK